MTPDSLTIRLTIPTFALAVLRDRARGQRQRLSRVVEQALLESIMLDEVGVVAERSPRLGRAFAEWFRATVKATRVKRPKSEPIPRL